MLVGRAIVVGLLLTACATPEQKTRDRLTDRIEDRVRLPEGAGQLDEYARYYAFAADGLVKGIYVPGYEPPDPNDGCSELLPDSSLRDIPCVDEGPSEYRLRVGQRRWMEDVQHLPLYFDGGCSVVTVIYDPKADKVIASDCNGQA